MEIIGDLRAQSIIFPALLRLRHGGETTGTSERTKCFPPTLQLSPSVQRLIYAHLIGFWSL